jgi:hypothetical protein
MGKSYLAVSQSAVSFLVRGVPRDYWLTADR